MIKKRLTELLFLAMVPACSSGGMVQSEGGGGTGTAGSTCIDTVLCIRGDHFDRQACACVPDTGPMDAGSVCIETQLCIRGDHWDSQRCACVPD